MPGVIRPYTLLDVLSTINNQNNNTGQFDTTTSGLGDFAEADEPSITTADAATAATPVNPGWDQSEWGVFNWQ